jgi:hypothetical protein
MQTLSQILIDSNAYLDLEATLPTGTELTTRANYANRAVQEASAVAQLKEFNKIYEVSTSALASIPLPANFKEFTTAPRLMIDDSGNWREYDEIRPEEKYDKGSQDYYCYVLGDPASGYTAVFNNLTASCSLSIIYQRYPSGLATLTDKCELSDPTYVTSKVESYVLQSRSDARFSTVDANATQKLQNMIGRAMKTPAGGVNKTPRLESYRLGE